MKKRSRYSKEFKQEAVNLMRNSGKSIQELCQELGVSKSSLHLWDSQFPTDAPQGELAAEYAKLKREHANLKKEHEILAKALAFFAKRND